MLSVNDPFQRLQEAASPAAFHDSGERRDPPKCHPDTRLAILKKIKDWIMGLDSDTKNAMIFWLYGPAGAGKSAIAQTTAEECVTEEVLLASYFFSRFDASRNHSKSLIATIAYQISLHFPVVQESIVDAIATDPLVFSRSLLSQISSLIVKPLQPLVESGYFEHHKSRQTVIIDGLDECEDRDEQIDILQSISETLQRDHLPIKFLICSRPEHDISRAFGAGFLHNNSTSLNLNGRDESMSDIKTFLRAKFSDIKTAHPFRAFIEDTWPKEGDIDHLVLRSSGQFIYAATVIKFVESARHRPPDRLELVFDLHHNHTEKSRPFAALDALYHHIFASVEDVNMVLQVLAYAMISSSNSVADAEAILFLNPGDIEILLCDLSSLVYIEKYSEDHSGYITIFYSSLRDFLFDKSRSGSLYIDLYDYHDRFAQNTIRFLQGHCSCTLLLRLGLHIQLASATEELHRAIVDLSIRELIPSGMEQIPDILSAILYSKFPDAKDLYHQHLQEFHQFLKEQLEEYYSEQYLTTLVVVASMSLDRRYNICLLPLEEELRYSGLHDFDYHCLQLKTWYSTSRFTFDAFLRTFLNEATQSGEYAITSARRAVAGIYLLRQACNHSEKSTFAEYNSRQRRNMRNAPRKWRQRVLGIRNENMWAHIDLDRRTATWFRERGTEHIFHKTVIRGPIWVHDIRRSDEGRAFRFVLYLLAEILPRAGHSEELIKSARVRTFGPLAQAYPKERKAARRAVDDYLKRMDSADR